MEKHLVYIVTDQNRVYIEAGYTQDIQLTFFELQSACSLLMGSAIRFNRIVHMEAFDSFSGAQRRKIEISRYTKMQKEKLIRRTNPNWLNIVASERPNAKEKVVVYAQAITTT